MSLPPLIDKYISSAEKVFKQMKLTKHTFDAQAQNVIEQAKLYLSDAKYYRDQGKLETSLASIAYCEGLLDALKLLGVVDFEWPTKPVINKEK
jgi:FAD synthetase